MNLIGEIYIERARVGEKGESLGLQFIVLELTPPPEDTTERSSPVLTAAFNHNDVDVYDYLLVYYIPS